MLEYSLHQGLGYRLSLAARINAAPFEFDLATLKLTRQMWCVLVAVGAEGKTTPSEIADYIGIIRPAVSRSLRQMERNGLLRRATGAGDKRTTQVALTKAGETALAQSIPLAEKTRHAFEKRLTKTEQAQLETLLRKLCETDRRPAGI